MALLWVITLFVVWTLIGTAVALIFGRFIRAGSTPPPHAHPQPPDDALPDLGK